MHSYTARFLLFVFLLPSACYLSVSQTLPDSSLRPTIDTIRLTANDTIRLKHEFIQRDSYDFRVNAAALLDSIDYRMNPRFGFLILTKSGREKVEADSMIIASYRAIPVRLPAVFRKRELIVKADTTRSDTLRVATSSTSIDIESMFGPELQKSGYLGRGFTVGTNRDLTLNSGFRLQLNGKLAEGIDITAALTDENTPIQPEGNTRTIQELDKVFIKLSGRNLAATIGDFSILYGGTEFGAFNRKVTGGFLGEGIGEWGSASASFASLKGTFHSVQFNGIDGVQGPYRLTGRNGEQRILVLAGSERVYVDGVEMTRGELHDYVIEYASGELFFKPRRLITSYSRITVDFEYADRQYVRNLLTAGGTGKLFDNTVEITARYLREGDDHDAPIDIQLTEADKSILREAGDELQRASTTGITYSGVNTQTGKGAGQYTRIDTMIASEPYTVFRYDPGTDSATYTISFSFVGKGKGDYIRKAIGFYEFTGKGNGDYAPLRLLPLPQMHQIGNVALRVSPVEELSVKSEFAVSSLDRNRFSAIDAGDDEGQAYTASVQWTPKSTVLGAFDVRGRFRSSSAEFVPIDRINEIEFNRRWDVVSPMIARETIREGQLSYKPLDALRLSGGAGSFSRGLFSSTRIEGGILFEPQQQSLPTVHYSAENISSNDGFARTTGEWFRHRGDITHRFSVAEPYIRFEQERKRNTVAGLDSLSPLSLAFFDIRPGVRFPEFWHMTLNAEFGWRKEESVIGGMLRPQSHDVLQQYTWTLRSWNDLSATASLVVRDKTFTEDFRLLGNKDIRSILTKSQIQYAPLQRAIVADLFYEVSTERTSKLERVFLKVPFGHGNYIYRGDENGNGIADEFEFEPARYDGEYILLTLPTDELFPVVDLKTNARLQLRPSRVLSGGSGSLLESLFGSLSTETVIRLDEKSSTERTSDIYFLRTGTFLNDSTTLRGFQTFRQDIFLFEQSRDFSVRARFDQNRGFSQFALVSERSFKRERSVRVRTQPVKEIGVQADLAFLSDAVISTGQSNRARDIEGTSLALDFSYRPYQRVEVGFVLATKSSRDRLPVTSIEAIVTSQTLRTTLSFDGPGRLRAELERNDVELKNAADNFPYELTDGKADGESWIARVNFDYRITSYMQATLSYLGRVEQERPMIHTARAEVRAFF